MIPSAPPRNRGFTLVEVVMAVGIVSFALVALLGTIAIGFDSGRMAKDETILSAATFSVLADLEQRPYAELAPGEARDPYWFDAEGTLLGASATMINGALYKCTVDLSRPLEGEGNTSLTSVSLTYEWPPSASNANVLKFNTSIADY